MSNMIDTLDDIADGYSVILSDVWGVVHNGIEPFPDACAALKRARENGKIVVLITNSPRVRDDVEDQLAAIGVPRDCWDHLVTSGDVTRELIAEGPRRIFHLGLDRDLSLYDGLDIELVEEQEASGVVCTGLFDDETEEPEDYAEMLARFRSRDLPFICANPDIVVERGHKLVWCAGALARDYTQLGGRSFVAGKPHQPIYVAALILANRSLGRQARPDEVLAIGDGVLTDVKGAVSNNINILFVTAGIHAREYDADGAPDLARLGTFLEGHGYTPVASIPRLR
ncbi:TIGR01459 family HAD-type hydrolase [Aliihoeflea aestuarii]|nr:TIGR01459 family HAD-type hydrolase [Aliihoeflea aestuarii]MCO6389698.1 TIGR01459 family HAD-type hydrolase [Aliihoeflea aestuarii]